MSTEACNFVDEEELNAAIILSPYILVSSVQT